MLAIKAQLEKITLIVLYQKASEHLLVIIFDKIIVHVYQRTDAVIIMTVYWVDNDRWIGRQFKSKATLNPLKFNKSIYISYSIQLAFL